MASGERNTFTGKLDLKVKDNWKVENASEIARLVSGKEEVDEVFLDRLANFIEGQVQPATVTQHLEPLFAKRLKVSPQTSD